MAATPEEMLREKLGSEFEGKIAAKISGFGGLLTRAAAVRLLCKENGIETEERLPLSQAASAKLPFSFQAKVERVFPVQAYSNGSDRSVRVHISDNGWETTLVLWNEQAKLIDGEISAGDEIECRGAYFRSGEIWVGKNGSVKKISGAAMALIANLAEGICNVEGEVGEVGPDHEYADRKTGEKKVLSSFQLCNGLDCRRVLVWQPKANEGQPKVYVGDSLFLENVAYRNNEIHFNSHSRMVVKKSSQEKTGVFESAVAKGEEAEFVIGGEKFRLGMKGALLLLGVASVPEGVGVETVFSIKASGCLGKSARYRVLDGKLSSLSFS